MLKILRTHKNKKSHLNKTTTVVEGRTSLAFEQDTHFIRVCLEDKKGDLYMVKISADQVLNMATFAISCMKKEITNV